MKKIEWTKLDSIIDKAARDCVNSEDDILGQLGIAKELVCLKLELSGQ